MCNNTCTRNHYRSGVRRNHRPSSSCGVGSYTIGCAGFISSHQSGTIVLKS